MTATVKLLGEHGVVVADGVGVAVVLGTVTDPAVGVAPDDAVVDVTTEGDTEAAGLVVVEADEFAEPSPPRLASPIANTTTATSTRAIESRRHQYVELGNGPRGLTTEGRRSLGTVFEA